MSKQKSKRILDNESLKLIISNTKPKKKKENFVAIHNKEFFKWMMSKQIKLVDTSEILETYTLNTWVLSTHHIGITVKTNIYFKYEKLRVFIIIVFY